MYTHINKNNPIPNLRPNHHKHTNTNEYKHKLIGTHKCSNQMRCGFLFLGINLCMYENGGVGLKKKERKKKKEEGKKKRWSGSEEERKTKKKMRKKKKALEWV